VLVQIFSINELHALINRLLCAFLLMFLKIFLYSLQASFVDEGEDRENKNARAVARYQSRDQFKEVGILIVIEELENRLCYLIILLLRALLVPSQLLHCRGCGSEALLGFFTEAFGCRFAAFLWRT